MDNKSTEFVNQEDIARKYFEKYYLGSHNTQRYADGNRDYVDGRIQRDWELFKRGHAFGWAVPAPAVYIDYQGATLVNLDLSSWENIKECIKCSPWIPAEYTLTEVTADICDFLLKGRSNDE